METLRTPYGNFTVYVNYLQSAEEDVFHISFVDNSNKLYVILMQEEAGQWIFVNRYQLADWVIAMQSQIEMLIRRELLREYVSITV